MKLRRRDFGFDRNKIRLTVLIACFCTIPFHSQYCYSQVQGFDIYCISNGDTTGDCYSFNDNSKVLCQAVPGPVIACLEKTGTQLNCTTYAPMQFSCKPNDHLTVKENKFCTKMNGITSKEGECSIRDESNAHSFRENAMPSIAKPVLKDVLQDNLSQPGFN